MTEGMINAGTGFIQRQFRVNVYQACKAHGVKEGDPVEIWMKPIKPVVVEP